ncbi:hypothetical protein R5R35_001175 [Gryllus longicercus]|uniref:Uncharacterized protein n=1 Tax=Gryllus longicercus TaxID=2509291 RepID=A0AAN9V5R9_9ORTH
MSTHSPAQLQSGHVPHVGVLTVDPDPGADHLGDHVQIPETDVIETFSYSPEI